MSIFPSKYILSIRPKEYLKQGLNHCGAYAVKAILSAYGKDDKPDPRDYHSHPLGRLTGGSIGGEYWEKALRSYGIKAKTDNAIELKSAEKIDLLKSLLLENNPVMMRIGNGYFNSKKYNPILGKIVGHWITLWGYDDKEEVFYIYDPALPRALYDKVPIGNTKRTYNEVLRDWNFGKWQPWYWYFSPKPYLYIKIV